MNEYENSLKEGCNLRRLLNLQPSLIPALRLGLDPRLAARIGQCDDFNLDHLHKSRNLRFQPLHHLPIDGTCGQLFPHRL